MSSQLGTLVRPLRGGAAGFGGAGSLVTVEDPASA